MYSSEGAPLHCAGEAAAGSCGADVELHSERTAADGGDRVQHPVPLVCGAEFGRGSPGGDGVHQESGPAAGSEYPVWPCIMDVPITEIVSLLSDGPVNDGDLPS